MNSPSHQLFTAYLGESFQLRTAPDSCEVLVLKSISAVLESPVSTPTHPKEHFSIIFESANQTYLPQQIYTFDHPNAGQFDIFIVPIGADRVSKNMRYQAIFN